jgi:hypothetical protein
VAWLRPYQVLFLAESEEELLEQIRQVPLEEYRENRQRLEEAEAPRRLLHRLHRDPLGTMRGLVKQHDILKSRSNCDTMSHSGANR